MAVKLLPVGAGVISACNIYQDGSFLVPRGTAGVVDCVHPPGAYSVTFAGVDRPVNVFFEEVEGAIPLLKCW